MKRYTLDEQTVTSMNISLISIMHEMLLFNVWNQAYTYTYLAL